MVDTQTNRNIAILILLPACIQQGLICNKPYILVGNDCYLDKRGSYLSE